jgi:hypothetical protein
MPNSGVESKLKKIERIQLLLHILQLATTPARKRNMILENDVNVALAREVANEAMSHWFNTGDENQSKRYNFDTLFIVAEGVERYKNDEIIGQRVSTVDYHKK